MEDPKYELKGNEKLNRAERRALEAMKEKRSRDFKSEEAMDKLRAARDESAKESAAKAFHGEFTGRQLNIYTCDTCREHIVTEDVDSGVTPFLIPCEFCDAGKMRSSMYRVFDLSMKEGYHWYMPGTEERATLNPWAAEHVSKGGLMLRKCDGSPTNHKVRQTIQGQIG